MQKKKKKRQSLVAKILFYTQILYYQQFLYDIDRILFHAIKENLANIYIIFSWHISSCLLKKKKKELIWGVLFSHTCMQLHLLYAYLWWVWSSQTIVLVQRNEPDPEPSMVKEMPSIWPSCKTGTHLLTLDAGSLMCLYDNFKFPCYLLLFYSNLGSTGMESSTLLACKSTSFTDFRGKCK